MAQTILVADDSPTIRKIVELTFSESGIRVETVGSGREAMDRLDALRPDLVLADVVMPDVSGYELCRSIKSSGHPVPVVLLAGTFEPYDPELARECGADAHLVKPFESSTLRDKVQQLLEPPVEPPAEPPAPESAEPQTDAVRTDPPPVSVDVSPELVSAVADVVVRRLSREVVSELAREIVPRLATELIRERIRELEAQELEEEQRSGQD